MRNMRSRQKTFNRPYEVNLKGHEFSTTKIGISSKLQTPGYGYDAIEGEMTMIDTPVNHDESINDFSTNTVKRRFLPEEEKLKKDTLNERVHSFHHGFQEDDNKHDSEQFVNSSENEKQDQYPLFNEFKFKDSRKLLLP